MTSVSVIIPAYNAKEYISDAIESILRQEYHNYEIIVVDDGSTDTTAETVGNYIGRGNIRYIRQINSGPGAARNRGIDEAVGEYICFLDSDDELIDTSLKKRVDFLEKHQDVSMVFSDYYRYQTPFLFDVHFKENKFLFKFNKAIIKHDSNEYIFGNQYYECALESSPFISTNTVMLRKSIVKSIGYFNTDLKVAEDVDYWLRICKVYKSGYIDEPLAKYNNYRSTLTKDENRFFLDSLSFYYELGRKAEDRAHLVLIKKKLSVIEFNYGYYLFRSKRHADCRVHFHRSMLNNINNFKAIKWYILSFFPKITHAIKRYEQVNY